MAEQTLDRLSSPGRNDQSAPKERGCKAFRNLKNWQIDQYRMAVDENKWYMSERFGRHVDWEEAEEDFLHNGYYGCAPVWRKQYCGDRCEHFSGCDLGRNFCEDEEDSAS